MQKAIDHLNGTTKEHVVAKGDPQDETTRGMVLPCTEGGGFAATYLDEETRVEDGRKGKWGESVIC